ncbi:integrase arm-type DNA-binding domain-containing protein [Microvirga terrae]|uniref:Integrase arm-type DNA-binding domain-containing protein n=1 Tax=Microvirga terrae TaxID=2740529 RepID=A0ABY5RRJ9_9HYPH|nr:site-specific integrase [Microvirga terrae]UVF18837.1 integrase arm-type DNA-binding domain-containing protein [Microvirga terrae]
MEIPDAVLPGLYLVVQPSGAKSWAVRYRFGGKPRKLTLGPYPALNLGVAREFARTALQAVASGRDPSIEKAEAIRQAREGHPNQDLVSSVIDEFITRHVRLNNKKRTAEEVERTFKLHVRPYWSDRRIQEIARRDVIELLDRIIDDGKPVQANRTLAVVRKLFNWAVDRSILDTSPVIRINAPAQEESRDRVVLDDELRLIWKAADEVGFPFGHLVKVLMLTAQRRDEVANARRSEFNKAGDLWVIPKERTKNSKEHDVPLSEAARGIFESLPRIKGAAGFMFTTNGNTAVSGFSKAKARLDGIMLRIAREEAAVRGEDPTKIQIKPWRLHDLRRTVASGMARLGQPVHVIEAVLNHRSGAISGVAAVYNRHSYLPEKRRALESWGQFILGLATCTTDEKSLASATAGSVLNVSLSEAQASG